MSEFEESGVGSFSNGHHPWKTDFNEAFPTSAVMHITDPQTVSTISLLLFHCKHFTSHLKQTS